MPRVRVRLSNALAIERVRTLAAVVLGLLLAACGSGPSKDEVQSLGERFRDAVRSEDVSQAADLASFPFAIRFQTKKRTFDDPEALKRFLSENGKELARRLGPRTEIEVRTADEILAGKEIYGKGRDGKEARALLDELLCSDKGAVVRLHEPDREGSYVVVNPDSNGTLRVAAFIEHR